MAAAGMCSLLLAAVFCLLLEIQEHHSSASARPGKADVRVGVVREGEGMWSSEIAGGGPVSLDGGESFLCNEGKASALFGAFCCSPQGFKNTF